MKWGIVRACVCVCVYVRLFRLWNPLLEVWELSTFVIGVWVWALDFRYLTSEGLLGVRRGKKEPNLGSGSMDLARVNAVLRGKAETGRFCIVMSQTCAFSLW